MFLHTQASTVSQSQYSAVRNNAGRFAGASVIGSAGLDWADGFLWFLQERCVAALARVERTDFLSPMCIGEVAHVSAEITYTSKHSVEVQVHVMSENILTGNSRWFSALGEDHRTALWFGFCCYGEA